jgi:hypothetical protein
MQEISLLALHPFADFGKIAGDAPPINGRHCPVQIDVQHGRVYIAFTANRRGVPQA